MLHSYSSRETEFISNTIQRLVPLTYSWGYLSPNSKWNVPSRTQMGRVGLLPQQLHEGSNKKLASLYW